MQKPFNEFQSELLHLFQCPCVAGYDVTGCLNSIQNVAEKILNKGRKKLWVRAVKGRFR